MYVIMVNEVISIATKYITVSGSWELIKGRIIDVKDMICIKRMQTVVQVKIKMKAMQSMTVMNAANDAERREELRLKMKIEVRRVLLM